MKTRVAVTYENGQVFQHFGHTEQFLAGFLRGLGVDTLICGGIGGGAKMALAQKNIAVFGGVTGETRKVVEDYLAGTLVFNANAECADHHHHDHENCGEHDHHCGGHCGH